jgi:hypothetical protein
MQRSKTRAYSMTSSARASKVGGTVGDTGCTLRAAMRDADLRFDNQMGIQRVRTEIIRTTRPCLTGSWRNPVFLACKPIW